MTRKATPPNTVILQLWFTHCLMSEHLMSVFIPFKTKLLLPYWFFLLLASLMCPANIRSPPCSDFSLSRQHSPSDSSHNCKVVIHCPPHNLNRWVFPATTTHRFCLLSLLTWWQHRPRPVMSQCIMLSSPLSANTSLWAFDLTENHLH